MIRSHLLHLQTIPHGSADRLELESLGLDPQNFLDFSASLNPWGPSPELLQRMQHWQPQHLSLYPERQAQTLRQCIADSLGRPASQVAVSNGSGELLRLLAQALLEPGELALSLAPSYGEYRLASQLVSAKFRTLPLTAPDFQLNPLEWLEQIQHYQPKLVYLCNPNNPTGQLFGLDFLQSTLETFPTTFFVFDEAYRDFVEDFPPTTQLLDRYSNLALVRSLTKAQGLAGLRLGYLVGAAPLVKVIETLLCPWNVNALAQWLGPVAIQDQKHCQTCRRWLQESKAWIVPRLLAKGYQVVPSVSNFMLVGLPFPARDLRRQLLDRGLIIRDAASLGLSHYFRLSLRSLEDCQVLERALPDLAAKNPPGLDEHSDRSGNPTR